MYDADEARIAGEAGWERRSAVAKAQAKAVLVERDAWGRF
jgi:hypothetical protein